MLGKSSENLRNAFYFAQEEAGRRGSNYIEPEHLLLGLIRVEESTVQRLLQELTIDSDQIKSEILNILTVDELPSPDNHTHLTERSKRVVDRAQKEAQQLENCQTGTEHLILGLLLEGQSTASLVLTKLGMSAENWKELLIKERQANPNKFVEAVSIKKLRLPVKIERKMLNVGISSIQELVNLSQLDFV